MLQVRSFEAPLHDALAGMWKERLRQACTSRVRVMPWSHDASVPGYSVDIVARCGRWFIRVPVEAARCRAAQSLAGGGARQRGAQPEESRAEPESPGRRPWV